MNRTVEVEVSPVIYREMETLCGNDQTSLKSTSNFLYDPTHKVLTCLTLQYLYFIDTSLPAPKLRKRANGLNGDKEWQSRIRFSHQQQTALKVAFNVNSRAGYFELFRLARRIGVSE